MELNINLCKTKTLLKLDELEDLICGELMNDADWTKGKLSMFFKPDHGYDSSKESYQNFIRYLVEIEPEDRKNFVKWLTGSRRLPMGGFGALDPQPTINLKRTFGNE